MSLGFGFGFPRGRVRAATTSPWTPAQITTALWLDAEDTGTITLNGSTVSQWSDKSGNARNATQATGALQPTYVSTGLNGKPTVNFTVSNKMPTLNGAANGSGNFSLFLVRQETGSIAGFTVPFAFYAGQTSVAHVNTPYATTNSFVSWRGTVRSNPNILANTWYINSWIEDGTTTVFHNNGLLTVTYTGGSTPNSASSILMINDGSANHYAEVVIVHSALSTDNRQKLEGYLAWKWGLQADLPVGHPYKNTPPTV